MLEQEITIMKTIITRQIIPNNAPSPSFVLLAPNRRQHAMITSKIAIILFSHQANPYAKTSARGSAISKIRCNLLGKRRNVLVYAA